MGKKNEQKQENSNKPEMQTESTLCSDCGAFISTDKCESNDSFESYMTIMIGDEVLCGECDEKLQNLGEFIMNECRKQTRRAIDNGMMTNYIQVCIKGKFVKDNTDDK